MQVWVRIEKKTALSSPRALMPSALFVASSYSGGNGGSGVQTCRWSCLALKSSLLFAEPAMEPLCCNVASAQVLRFPQPICLSVHPSHSSQPRVYELATFSPAHASYSR